MSDFEEMKETEPQKASKPDKHLIWLCKNYSTFHGYSYSVEEPRDEFHQVDYTKFVSQELFELPANISLEVEANSAPRFYDHVTGKFMLVSELTMDGEIPELSGTYGGPMPFRKVEQWHGNEAVPRYIVATQDDKGMPTEAEAYCGILNIQNMDGFLRCMDIDGRTGAMNITSVTDNDEVRRTAVIPIEHLTEELTTNIRFDRHHRMFDGVRDIIENQMRVDEAMHEPEDLVITGNMDPAVHAVRLAIRKSLEPFADEATGFVEADRIRQAYTFKPLGLEVAKALHDKFPADDLKAAFIQAMPDGKVLADVCLLTRKDAKDNLLQAMSNFYDFERNAGLSAEQVNKAILSLAQQNHKNKAQENVK